MLDDDLDDETTAAVVAGLLVAAILVLLAMGRTLWGTAPGPGLWTGDIQSRFNSQRLADPYSFTHVCHGLIFFMLLWATLGDRLGPRWRLTIAVGLESIWEIVENTSYVIERFRETTMAQGYYGDSILNSVGDIGAMIVGFAIAMRLSNRWWVVGLFIALEGALALWIRDNMTLNIVMLIHPIPGIRAWQAG